MKVDLTVIGGGPGGYVAAIRAAQRGLKTILIEKNKLGGTCLNVGCIPTKAILESISIIDEIEKWDGSILNVDKYSLNYSEVMKHKTEVVSKLVGGVDSLLASNGVEVIQGTGKIINRNTIKIYNNDSNREIKTDKILIATGSQPIELPGFSYDNPGIIDNTGALSLDEVPEELLIIGGGVIGSEFANIFNSLGSKVTIIEMMDRLIPEEDKKASTILKDSFELAGINVITNAKADSWENIGDKYKVTYSKNKQTSTINADKILVSIGRKPVLSELGLENAGVKYNKKGIIVNSRLRTESENIYAVGDVIGNYQLAHVAFQEGMVAVDNILGKDKQVNYGAVPSCIYTHPEIASVGLNEEKAREKYGDNIKIGEFQYSHNGKALSEKEEGVVKVIVESEYNEIVGALIVGAHATELINQFNILKIFESTIETVDDIIFPHPTITESIKEAALDSLDIAIHG